MTSSKQDKQLCLNTFFTESSALQQGGKMWDTHRCLVTKSRMQLFAPSSVVLKVLARSLLVGFRKADQE